MGADELVDPTGDVARRYPIWADALNAEVLRPELGKPTVIGGADVVFDCVASGQSIDDGLRFTAGGGTFVLVGMPGIPKGVDWTPLWYKEITIHAAYAYGPERRGLDGSSGKPRDTFELAIDAMKTCGQSLAKLVGEPFALAEVFESMPLPKDVVVNLLNFDALTSITISPAMVSFFNAVLMVLIVLSMWRAARYSVR